MRSRHTAPRMLLVVAAVLLAACGARVSDSQIQAAQGAAGPGSAAVQGNDAVGGGDAVGNTVDAGGAPIDGGTDTASAGGNTTATTAAAPGGNGGATDVGVSADTINLGNVSTLSGPVPGLFTGAVVGTQAAIAYQNSIGGVHGRKLRLDVRDDQFDTGQNRSQTTDLVRKAFALVGGFSLYDDAAVGEIEKAGMPAVQVPLATGLQKSPMNFAVAPVQRGSITGPFKLLKAKFPDSITAAAGIYSDIPAAKDNWLNNKVAAESLGYEFVYERGHAATETDFTADVVRMRQAGVKFLFSNSDVKTVARIAKAMAQQGFTPDVYLTYTAYDATFIPLAGPAGNNTVNISTQAMYLGEDGPFIPEIRLMREWLQKVKPGYTPELYAAYGWASVRLLVKAMEQAGPKLTRAGVVGALQKIDAWNSHGLLPEVGPASKRPAVCFILVRVNDGKFERWESPAPPAFNCDSTFHYRK